MKQSHGVLREDSQTQIVVHHGRGFEVGFGRFLDERIDDVGLAAELDLALDATINALAFVFAADNCLDRRAAGRQFINDRNIKIAINGHRQAAWYRRCGHNQNIGIFTRRLDLSTLHHAEAMLFVDDGEAETIERDLVLNDRVGADDHVNFARSECGINSAFLGYFRAADKHFDLVAGVRKYFQGIPEMLRR